MIAGHGAYFGVYSDHACVLPDGLHQLLQIPLMTMREQGNRCSGQNHVYFGQEEIV